MLFRRFGQTLSENPFGARCVERTVFLQSILSHGGLQGFSKNQLDCRVFSNVNLPSGKGEELLWSFRFWRCLTRVDRF